MAAPAQTASSWVFPDRDAWDALLEGRPKPQPVMRKPLWWRGPWPGRWHGTPPGQVPGDRKLQALRGELAWAQRCFHYAESALPDSQARAKVRRIADALERIRKAIDSPQKAEGALAAADGLTGVGRHDPAKHPRAFIDAAGEGLSAAGQALAASRFEAVAYWGRVLIRSGGFLRTMKHELPGGR